MSGASHIGIWEVPGKMIRDTSSQNGQISTGDRLVTCRLDLGRDLTPKSRQRALGDGSVTLAFGLVECGSSALT